MKTVKTIQSKTLLPTKQLRVADYVRVSHSHLMQSLSHQISYYSEKIQHHPNWEYKGVYVDQAISGRTRKHRKEYERLIEDCQKGEIDMILTKSISRFGRNTVELLSTIRELKQLNISIRFEKEKIDTLTTDGELLLTLLAGVAQEESESISQNIRWKVKKKFEQGLPHVPQDMYGYRWQIDQYVIEPHEASVIQQIYEWYLSGITPTKIAKRLNERGETTRKGNAFTRSIVHRVLEQETYTGVLILQKTYRHTGKGRSIPNDGVLQKYIVEHAHDAIISKELFERVQIVKSQRSYHNKERRAK